MIAILFICMSITIIEFTNGRPGVIYRMDVTSSALSALHYMAVMLAPSMMTQWGTISIPETTFWFMGLTV